MPRPNVPAAIIAQRGKKITLIDDREVTVVYTFSSLMRIEEDFGSVAGALESIAGGEKAKAFTALSQIMAAGLEHERTDDGQGLDDTNVLRMLLDPMRFTDYSDALGEALTAAFPQADTDEQGGDDAADPTKDSPGGSGITSQPSPSDGVNTSSGTS